MKNLTEQGYFLIAVAEREFAQDERICAKVGLNYDTVLRSTVVFETERPTLTQTKTSSLLRQMVSVCVEMLFVPNVPIRSQQIHNTSFQRHEV